MEKRETKENRVKKRENEIGKTNERKKSKDKDKKTGKKRNGRWKKFVKGKR